MFNKSTFVGSKWVMLAGLVLVLSGLSSVVSPIARAGSDATLVTCPIRLEAVEQELKVELNVKIKTHSELYKSNKEYTTPGNTSVAIGVTFTAEPSALSVQHDNDTKRFQGWVKCKGDDCNVYVYKPNGAVNKSISVLGTCDPADPKLITLRAIYGPQLSDGRVNLTIAAARQNDASTDVSVQIKTNYGYVTTPANLILLKWTKFEATAPPSATITGYGQKQFQGWEICAEGSCIIDTMSGHALVVPFNLMTVSGSIRAIYGPADGSTVELNVGAGVVFVDWFGNFTMEDIAGVQITTNYTKHGIMTTQAGGASLQVLKWIRFTAEAPALVQYNGLTKSLLGWFECTTSSSGETKCNQLTSGQELQVQRVEQSTTLMALYQ